MAQRAQAVHAGLQAPRGQLAGECVAVRHGGPAKRCGIVPVLGRFGPSSERRLDHGYDLAARMKAAGEEPVGLLEQRGRLHRPDPDRHQKVADGGHGVALLGRDLCGVRALGVHPQHDQAREGSVGQQRPALGRHAAGMGAPVLGERSPVGARNEPHHLRSSSRWERVQGGLPGWQTAENGRGRGAMGHALTGVPQSARKGGSGRSPERAGVWGVAAACAVKPTVEH